MNERLILNSEYSLKGWEKLPYAIYNDKIKKALFIKKSEFELILECSGKKEINIDELNPSMADFIKYLKDSNIVRNAKEGETRNLYYQFYNNMYKESVHWSITGRCNYKCLHCFQSAPCGELKQPSLEECKNIIRQFKECGIRSVDITGGEPLVHPDFMAIVDELIANDIDISPIYSNGKLVTQELLDAFHERGIKPSFQISFDGVGYHDWMRNVPGAEKAALDAIRLLRKNGHAVSCAMCLCRENIGSLRETVKVLAEAGCSALKTQCASPSGLWAYQSEHFLSYDEVLQAYLDYIPQYAEDQMPLSIQMEGFFCYNKEQGEYLLSCDKTVPKSIHLDYKQLPVCEIVHKGFYLGPDGNVVPCMALDYIELTKQFPNVYETPLQEILSNSSFMDAMNIRVKDLLNHTEKCINCEYQTKCCGGCRALAASSHPDDYLAVDEITCKIFREHWDEKLYAVADQYFKRNIR